ncbi:MAG TPA: hypothetical protein O0X27_02125 [Methanocorpusculum sp.]|nr:hypothetical protein [Methanocorpusculum sp.]
MNNGSLELYTRTDELRARHAAFLQDYLGKNVDSQESACTLAARTLVCDAAQGETVIPDYKSLKKLLKENRRKLKGVRNKVMAAAYRSGKMDLPTKETKFAGKTDLEILTMIDEESAALLLAYDNLIAAVKAVI